MNKIKIYISIILNIFSLILFLTSHFLQVIFGQTREFAYWFGFEVSNFLTDISLLFAIILQIITIILWFEIYINEILLKYKEIK